MTGLPRCSRRSDASVPRANGPPEGTLSDPAHHRAPSTNRRAVAAVRTAVLSSRVGRRPGFRMPGRVETEVSEKGRTISRDLRVNQMIRIPQVRVVDEEGAQLGVMPTPQALEMAQERGLDLVEVAPMAAPPVVKFLDFGQYKYELTKREKEAKRKQRSVTFKEVRLSPKIGVGRLRHEGPSRDRVPRGRRPDQGHRPLPRTGADPPGARPEPPREVRRSGQGARGRGADAAARRQVDAHHDGIDSTSRRSTMQAARGRRRRRQPSRRSRPTRTAPADGAPDEPRQAPAPRPRPRPPRRAEAAEPPAEAAPSHRPRQRPSEPPAPSDRRRTEDRRPRRPRAGDDRRVRPACRR